MVRDRQETKARILAAVGKLLAESGFRQLGVNAIAREAGVDKVLIYRYFNDLPTLLQTFGQEGDYWISLEALLGHPSDSSELALADRVTDILLRFLHDLKQRSITQEILRWELLERNELTDELVQAREQTSIACLTALEQTCSFPVDRDVPAISAILVAAMVYLVLRSQSSSTFLGLDLSSPESWQRIEKAAASLVAATL